MLSSPAAALSVSPPEAEEEVDVLDVLLLPHAAKVETRIRTQSSKHNPFFIVFSSFHK